MYKVYLDNNIIVSIEDGEYSVEQFLSKNDYVYYFSQAHFEELLEAKNNPPISQTERLNLISKLSKKNRIITGVGFTPELFDKEPAEMFRLVDTPIRQMIDQAVNKDDKSALSFRQKLGLDAKILNNQSPEMVLSIINNRMKERIGLDIFSYLKETEAINGRAMYHTLMQLIDMANYWGDKKTDHSNVARMYDAAHAYFAQICDVLVTNDKKMSKKVQAIYSFLNVKTKVVNACDFLNVSSFK